MKRTRQARSSALRIGAEGALLALSPLPFLFAAIGTGAEPLAPWRITLATLAAVAGLLCALSLFRLPSAGKLFGCLFAAGGCGCTWPYIADDPFTALIIALVVIGLVFFLLDFQVVAGYKQEKDRQERCFQRGWWAMLVVPLIVLLAMIVQPSSTGMGRSAILGSSIIAQLLLLHWAFEQKAKLLLLLPIAGIVLLGWLGFLQATGAAPLAALALSLFGLFVLSLCRDPQVQDSSAWWLVLLDHPARILLVSFFALCALGTILLLLPPAAGKGAIGVIDAAFTAVSAVCVTGLIVLDTPHDFTMTGQVFIVLLIQLGGLGIMSITTVALNAAGRRLSLRQERLLSSITDTDRNELFQSLALILKFTFSIEALGALLLLLAFYAAGDPMADALWRAIFTAISAFCNAGFALQGDSLIPYQGNPFVLHTVATLIVAGGMAPATCLLAPRWLAGKRIPIPARIALVTTVILLVSGMAGILAFEWNGVLAGLPLIDKLHNAWFQSVTLRTAGFNSVDIASVASPTFMVMISFMFIGGSPGGTAGGVKTTTLGILALTFWANVTNRKDIVVQNRTIPSLTVYQAITVVASGIIVWFTLVVMLEATQLLPARDLIFEVTSALATVGLSTGATQQLDEIGKIIIIIAMFVGRVGPITLFMLLSNERDAKSAQYLDVKISIT